MIGQLPRIAEIEAERVAAPDDLLVGPAAGRADDRQSEGLGFEHRSAERLDMRRTDEYVAGAPERPDVVGLRNEGDEIVQSFAVDEGADVIDVRQTRVAHADECD